MRFWMTTARSMGKFRHCSRVYANAATLEQCREQIEEVLEEWILIRVFKNLPLPMVDGQGGCLVPRFGPIVE